MYYFFAYHSAVNLESRCCSMCSKDPVKACSKCKVQYYCGKQCQMKDWKFHKKICSDLQETAFVKENLQPKAGLPFGDFMTSMMEMMLSINIGPWKHALEIPKYHDEYKKHFPRDVKFYRRLKASWVLSRMIAMEHFVHLELTTKTMDHVSFMKCWGSSAGSDELRVFLSTNPKPGEIFRNRPVTIYGYLEDKEIYQCMRNSPVPSQVFEFGETCVAIGFVDLYPLVIGSICSSKKALREQDRSMTYIGFIP